MISRYRSIDVSSHTLSPAPKLRKRLWQAGLALALFIATLAIVNGFVPADKAVSRKSAGHDFLAFYTAGAFVRTGRAAELYDIPTIAAAEQELARHEGLELRDDQFGPYWNPPFFACVFAPLSALPYQTAWTVWFAMNLICAGAAIAILSRLIARRSADWRNSGRSCASAGRG